MEINPSSFYQSFLIGLKTDILLGLYSTRLTISKREDIACFLSVAATFTVKTDWLLFDRLVQGICMHCVTCIPCSHCTRESLRGYSWHHALSRHHLHTTHAHYTTPSQNTTYQTTLHSAVHNTTPEAPKPKTIAPNACWEVVIKLRLAAVPTMLPTFSGASFPYLQGRC